MDRSRFYTVVLVAILSGYCHAQSQRRAQSGDIMPTVSWTRSYDLGWQLGFDPVDDNFRRILLSSFLKTDSRGHLYAAWTGFTDSNGYYIHVGKIVQSGNEEWTRRYDDTSRFWDGQYYFEEYAGGLNVDTDDNVIVAGGSYGRMLTIKYSSGGDTLWSRRWPEVDSIPKGAFNESLGARRLALGAEGRIYVAGDSPNRRPSIVSYGKDGDLRWSRELPELWYSDQRTIGLALDIEENVFLAGKVFDDSTRRSSKLGIAKFDQQGNLQWRRAINACEPGDILLCADRNGRIYCSAYSYPFRTTLASLDAEGCERWLEVRSDSSRIVNLSPDGEGNLLVCRSKYSSSGGRWCIVTTLDSLRHTLWERQYPGLKAFVFDNGVVWNARYNLIGNTVLERHDPVGISDSLLILNQWMEIHSMVQDRDSRCTYISGVTEGGEEEGPHFVVISLDQSVTGVEVDPLSIPAEPELMHNFPNPFNPATDIRYQIPDNRRVTLTVFDILGREVALLVNNILPAGEHAATWNAAGVASGLYFCRLEAVSLENPTKRFVDVKKMVLLR